MSGLKFQLFLFLWLLHCSLSEPFFFKNQPEDMHLQEGKEFRLYCIVEPANPAGATYTWYKSDEFKVEESVIEDKLEILEEFQSPVLYINQIARTDTGYYHCKVETPDPAYKLFSSTAHIVVNYVDQPDEVPLPLTITWSDNKPEEYLGCSTPNSYPEKDIVWKKDGVRISNPRIFVFPELTYVGNSPVQRGVLMIININKDEDAGLYECRTDDKDDILLSSYQVVTEDGFDSPNQRTPIIVFSSYTHTGGSVDIPEGGRVTLVCAAKGYPTPSYSWFIQGDDEDVAIRGSDSLLLEDSNRRLVASNINSKITYKCVINNNANGRPNERLSHFYISITDAPADYSISVTRLPEKNHVLKPNQYTPFTLECYVEKTGQNQILWLKNGEKLQWNARFTTDFSDKMIDGVLSKGSTLTFDTSNESDLGVYQCVIVNEMRLKTETAYVTLEKDSLSYQVSSRQPEYFYLPGPYYVDEAEEACNNRKAHLVSILDANENAKVRQLAEDNGAGYVWIGLTREDPDPVGSWVWTLSGDPATTFSNWADDKPDNKYGAQEYTVMSESTGKWSDVNKNTRRPAVCKLYEVVCPSIDKFYEGRVRARGWESDRATYEVGQEVEVFCRFPGDKVLTVKSVTCGQNRQFSPATLDECPEVPSSTSPLTLSSSLLLLVLLISSITRTS